MAAHASARAFVRVPPKDVGMRLDRWLRSRLPQVTQAHLCRLVRKKMVRLAVKDQVGELARAPSTLAPTWRHLSTDIGSRIEAGMFVSLPAELSASLVCPRRPESDVAPDPFSHNSERVLFPAHRNRTPSMPRRRVQAVRPATRTAHLLRLILANRSTIRHPRGRRPSLRTARI